ncbi:MAG: restriction endonuclease [Planctomycetota bacterium]
MAVPKFQKMMAPTLKFLFKNGEAHVSKQREYLVEYFGLTEADLAEVYSTGQRRIVNRAAWALVHLRMAGLVRRKGRGIWQITEAGRSYLKEHPGPIEYSDLREFPQYVEAHAGGNKKKVPQKPPIGTTDETPEERIASASEEIRQAVGEDLLERVRDMSPESFEQLVVDLIVKMGYGGSRKDAGERVGCAGDGGVDGIVKQDVLGLDVIYLQAKRWKSSVGRPDVQGFVGTLEGKHATKGVMLTTSRFTNEAQQYALNLSKKVILIDGRQLVDHMIDFQLGVQPAETFTIPAIDTDYFDPDD